LKTNIYKHPRQIRTYLSYSNIPYTDVLILTHRGMYVLNGLVTTGTGNTGLTNPQLKSCNIPQQNQI